MEIKFSNCDEYFHIDDTDYELIKNHSWMKCSSGYARSSIKSKMIRLHRFLLSINEKEVYVDHIDGNISNYKRSNLRISCAKTNCRNRGRTCRNKSGYKGVSFCKKTGKYRASIALHKKDYNIGRFKTAQEAAMAYDKKAKELHGEFARLNFKE